MQLLRKTQSEFAQLDQQQIFYDKFLILKFLCSELEQFHSSSSSSSKKLFFRVQVRVQVLQKKRVFSSSSSSSQPWSRGHNLGAKAKDMKKIRGQGPTFRGQTFSRSRTEEVETKAKDRGHNFSKLWF